MCKFRNAINDEVYIGSTIETLTRRLIKHKSDSKNAKYKSINLYCLMNEIGSD